MGGSIYKMGSPDDERQLSETGARVYINVEAVS